MTHVLSLIIFGHMLGANKVIMKNSLGIFGIWMFTLFALNTISILMMFHDLGPDNKEPKDRYAARCFLGTLSIVFWLATSIFCFGAQHLDEAWGCFIMAVISCINFEKRD